MSDVSDAVNALQHAHFSLRDARQRLAKAKHHYDEALRYVRDCEHLYETRHQALSNAVAVDGCPDHRMSYDVTIDAQSCQKCGVTEFQR